MSEIKKIVQFIGSDSQSYQFTIHYSTAPGYFPMRLLNALRHLGKIVYLNSNSSYAPSDTLNPLFYFAEQLTLFWLPYFLEAYPDHIARTFVEERLGEFSFRNENDLVSLVSFLGGYDKLYLLNAGLGNNEEIINLNQHISKPAESAEQEISESRKENEIDHNQRAIADLPRKESRKYKKRSTETGNNKIAKRYRNV